MSDTHRQAYYILELFIDIVNLVSVSITIKFYKKWLFVGGVPLISLFLYLMPDNRSVWSFSDFIRSFSLEKFDYQVKNH